MSGSKDGRDPHVVAAAKGLVVVLPRPHELFVDIDCEADLANGLDSSAAADEVP